jgi:hypothetical protein
LRFITRFIFPEGCFNGGQGEPSEPRHGFRSEAISGLQSILIAVQVKAAVAITNVPQ